MICLCMFIWVLVCVSRRLYVHVCNMCKHKKVLIPIHIQQSLNDVLIYMCIPFYRHSLRKRLWWNLEIDVLFREEFSVCSWDCVVPIQQQWFKIDLPYLALDMRVTNTNKILHSYSASTFIHWAISSVFKYTVLIFIRNHHQSHPHFSDSIYHFFIPESVHHRIEQWCEDICKYKHIFLKREWRCRSGIY